MSKRCEVTITCPKCNEEHPFVMWQSINTQLDPEMRAAVKDRSAFQFICPTCVEKTYVDYGFLYHQMEDGIMIHYASSDEDAEEIYKMVTNKEQDSLFHDMLDADYLIRIVRSQNELREKISIFDEGLDDRIIEIIKLFVLAKYQEQNFGDKSIALYYVKKEEDNVFRSIWAEYERVILQSLVTSFGLDFLVHDQHGGDVDTIHNVREIGSDSQMEYKNAANAAAYDARGEYDTALHFSESVTLDRIRARAVIDHRFTSGLHHTFDKKNSKNQVRIQTHENNKTVKESILNGVFSFLSS